MAQRSKSVRVIPVVPKKIISQQPKPLLKEMRGFGGQDPDLMKNCIFDLEPLTFMTTVLIRPKIIPLEKLTGWEREEEYDICTVDGDVLYKVLEETDCCQRNMCGEKLDPYNIYIKTRDGRPVIQLTRLLTIGSFMCSQFVQTLQVFCPPGKLIGTVERTRDLLVPKFEVKNSYAETEFHIEAPYFTFNCCGDVDYVIFNSDMSSTIGKVAKQWRGVYKPAFTKTEYFGVEFPVGLDINLKVMLLGASFLIDYVYFGR